MVQEEFARIHGINYFNTAMTSIPPKCVEKAYESEMNIYLSNFGSEDKWNEERAIARKGIADLIGAKSSDIALLSNTVEGIGLIANDYPWDSEKEIALYFGEHMSNRLPWIIGEKKGRFKLCPIECDGSLSTEAVIKSLSDKTQALALSFVQFSDGARVDMVHIGKECRRRGILFIVDGIQAIGRVHIDVESMYMDYLVCGAHKGLLVRNGISFVYCRRNVLDKLYPSVASCMSVKPSLSENTCTAYNDINWFDDARRLENGNRCHQGVYALIASTKFLASIGTETIEEHILYLQAKLVRELGEAAFALLPSCGIPSGIIRVNFPAKAHDEVNKLLKQNLIYSTVRNDNVRFCINFFNTVDQITILAKAIREILKIGGRYK